MQILKLLLSYSIALLIVGCSAKPLNEEAKSVIVSHHQPKDSCTYIGPVHGNQGDWLTGGYTSHKNLEIGAMNDIRNEAYKMGADYVELATNRAGVIGSGSMAGVDGAMGGYGHSAQTSTVLSGNAYRCKQ